MEKIKYYPLGVSQSTINMQAMFSSHKEVLNINVSITTKQNWDYVIFKKAFNKEIERNDCLRIRFKSKFLGWKQHFIAPFEYTPEILDFTGKTQEEQFEKLQALAETPIKINKKIPFRVFFVKTYDNKTMIYCNVSHLIFDIFGLVFFFEDLNKVYDAIVSGGQMPEMPTEYQDLIKGDVDYLSGDKIKRDEEYFKKYFAERKPTGYVGMHGNDCELWKKRKAKGKLMKMFLFNNKTGSAILDFDEDCVKSILSLCETYKYSPALVTYVFLNCALSYLNDGEENIIGLDLCNGRATAKEFRCGGTRAQSIPLYMNFNKDKTFIDCVSESSATERELMRHFRYPELKRELIMHKAFNSTYADTHYAFTYSFIPVNESDKYDLTLYSSNRFVLPGYLATMFDVKTQKMKQTYLYQKVLMGREGVEKYHKTVMDIVRIVAKNPACTIKEIFEKLKGKN